MTDRKVTVNEADRTVHAFGDGMQVVRYDRSGKWYLEPTDPSLTRQQVSVEQAADAAIWHWYHNNGSVNFDRSGGTTFDRKVRAKVNP